MANSGNTTTSAVSGALPDMIMSARQVAEYEGVMRKLVRTERLGQGVGPTWTEYAFNKLTAQPISETTILDNPQQISGSRLGITPTQIGIATFITDRVQAQLSPKAYAQMGSLAMNAIVRKQDLDLLTVLDTGTPLSGAGTTLASGVVRSATNRIQGNTTEPGRPPFRFVAHPYQVKDIEDEIVAGVGTYPVGEGLTARVFAEGFAGMIGQAQVYPDGNISIDSSADAKGGVFAQDGIILVQGQPLRTATERSERIGGGGDWVIIYDDYAAGVPNAVWYYEVYSDATVPTS